MRHHPRPKQLSASYFSYQPKAVYKFQDWIFSFVF